jgi:hypothetical protein
VIFDTVGRLGWSVGVKHHVIRQVITDVLGADVWWGDEDDDEGVKLGIHHRGDGTARKKPGKGGIGHKNKRNVPKAIIEEGCIVRRLSSVLFFVSWVF